MARQNDEDTPVGDLTVGTDTAYCRRSADVLLAGTPVRFAPNTDSSKTGKR